MTVVRAKSLSTDATHNAKGGGFTASEMQRRHQLVLDQVESTVLCAFCPGWKFTGPAIDAHAAALQHRLEEHPTIGSARRRTVKRECKVPGCSKYCKPGSDRCWDHSAVKETAGAGRPAEAAVSSTAAGRDLLDRMDAGLPLNDEPVLEEVAVGERLGPDVVATSPNTDERTGMECKVEGCTGDASGAPRAGSHAKLCASHRAERSAEMSAQRVGKPRGSKVATGGGKASRQKRSRTAVTTRKRGPRPLSGPNVSKAERLLAAARNVDEVEALLDQAREQLKQAVAELAA